MLINKWAVVCLTLRPCQETTLSEVWGLEWKQVSSHLLQADSDLCWYIILRWCLLFYSRIINTIMGSWLELGVWVSCSRWTQRKMIVFTSVWESCQKYYLLQATLYVWNFTSSSLQHLWLHLSSSSLCFQTTRLLRGGRSWCFSQLGSTLENLPPPSSVKVKF